MSLAQHVSVLEGIDREPEVDVGEDFHPIARKISYDVLQPPSQVVPIAEQTPASTSAYKHSVPKRFGRSTRQC